MYLIHKQNLKICMVSSDFKSCDFVGMGYDKGHWHMELRGQNKGYCCQC